MISELGKRLIGQSEHRSGSQREGSRRHKLMKLSGNSVGASR